jgi:hypothetical protein
MLFLSFFYLHLPPWLRACLPSDNSPHLSTVRPRHSHLVLPFPIHGYTVVFGLDARCVMRERGDERRGEHIVIES